MSRLQGKRTLITGGTSGIGLETAKQFLAEGARVIVTGVNPESIAKAQAELGSEVLVLRADSASIDAQKELAQAVQAHYGQLDVAFLNAGVSVWLPIEEWTEEMFDRSFDINVKGPYFLIQALLPVFANPASVVLNTSVSAHLGDARSSVYGATKAAFLNMSKTLSSELLPRGIRVNAVSPGPIDTPLYDKLVSPMPTVNRSTKISPRPFHLAGSVRPRKWPRPCCTWRRTSRGGRLARSSSSTVVVRSSCQRLLPFIES
uniref:SDR family NAD(P)-dependent oxidoreductase n=1 Tax=Pseudomonas sp. MS646 TaxID=3118751 RepID=UPI00403F4160